MERTKNKTNKNQLLAVRAGILGSAFLVGLGIFLYAGNTPTQNLRGDILSPEYLAQADVEVLGGTEATTTTEDTMTTDERDAMVDDLLMEEGNNDDILMTTTASGAEVMTTTDPMDYGTDFVEDTTGKDLELLQAKIQAQELRKAQLRAAAERDWAEQDAMNALHGAAPEEAAAMGGPEAMPQSGPEVLLFAAAGLALAIATRKYIFG